MITTGTKWFFGLGFVTLVLAWAYGWTTGGNGLGPVTVGYKGGVGDHFGYGVLLSAAVISFVLGVVLDRRPRRRRRGRRRGRRHRHRPRGHPGRRQLLAGRRRLRRRPHVVGLVTTAPVFVFGLITLGIVLIEWTAQAWADQATGDPATNREIRNRLMNPIEVPAAGLLAVALVVVAFSRVFLASRPRTPCGSPPGWRP